MDETKDSESLEFEGDQACRGYRNCLKLIEQGEFNEAALIIAELWSLDPRYAKALEDKLVISRRWQSAKGSEAERKKFWEWMDSRP